MTGRARERLWETWLCCISSKAGRSRRGSSTTTPCYGSAKWAIDREGTVLGRLASLQLICTGAWEEIGISRAENLLRDVANPNQLALVLCVRGHAALAAGRGGLEELNQVETFARELNVAPKSALARHLAALQRACAAFEASEQDQLFRGHLIDDIGLRCWLHETGQLPGPRDP